MGLLPYGFTITGHIIFTFQIAFSLFFGITIINIVNNQFGFLKIFMPTGVPVFLVPFLVIIEVVSYLIRPFSLSVRLFANMLAGHTLLKILSISTFALMKRYMLLSIFPLLFIVFISILELGIAIVQAYIFTILVSIYINDIYSAH
jgi:ATP synthase subunit 6